MQLKESNYKNYASVQTVLSIKLEFGIYIVGHHFSYYINFGLSRKDSFLQNVQNVIHYGL